MLILTRKPKETIRIGKDIKVTVLGFRGSQVRIGVLANKETIILREELLGRAEAGGPVLDTPASAGERG